MSYKDSQLLRVDGMKEVISNLPSGDSSSGGGVYRLNNYSDFEILEKDIPDYETFTFNFSSLLTPNSTTVKTLVKNAYNVNLSSNPTLVPFYGIVKYSRGTPHVDAQYIVYLYWLIITYSNVYIVVQGKDAKMTTSQYSDIANSINVLNFNEKIKESGSSGNVFIPKIYVDNYICQGIVHFGSNLSNSSTTHFQGDITLTDTGTLDISDSAYTDYCFSGKGGFLYSGNIGSSVIPGQLLIRSIRKNSSLNKLIILCDFYKQQGADYSKFTDILGNFKCAVTISTTVLSQY